LLFVVRTDNRSIRNPKVISKSPFAPEMLRIRCGHNAISIRKLPANSQKTNWRFVFKKL